MKRVFYYFTMCSIFANLFYKIEVYVNFVSHFFSNTHVLLISTFFVQLSLFLSRPSYIFILAPPLTSCYPPVPPSFMCLRHQRIRHFPLTPPPRHPSTQINLMFAPTHPLSCVFSSDRHRIYPLPSNPTPHPTHTT
jgi:hypothetical protein